MDDIRFDNIYNAACDHEPSAEELEILNKLVEKHYNNQDEAIIAAFFVGRFSHTLF